MSKYETTFIIDSQQKAEDIQSLVTKVESFIKNNGGQIETVEDWGKKRLAYEINRKQYGNYYQINFDGPGNLPELLEREYRLEEGILRFLTIKTHPKAEEARAKHEQNVKPAETKPAESDDSTDKAETASDKPQTSEPEEESKEVKEEVEASTEKEE